MNQNLKAANLILMSVFAAHFTFLSLTFFPLSSKCIPRLHPRLGSVTLDRLCPHWELLKRKNCSPDGMTATGFGEHTTPRLAAKISAKKTLYH